jgi:hypothetical protein
MPETAPARRKPGRQPGAKNLKTPKGRVTKKCGVGRGNMPTGTMIPRDFRRWFQVETLGMSIEQVALKENCRVSTVEDSINRLKEWQFRNRISVLETKAIEVLMQRVDGMGEVYDRGMQAEKAVHVNRETGVATMVPDIAMQLKTVEGMRGLIETVQPKTPLVNSNTQYNLGVMVNGAPAGNSFEAILRKKREARGLLNSETEGSASAPQTHAEEIDAEFKDLGGDDDGEDGNEDEE